MRAKTLADQGELRLREDALNGSSEVRIRAPASLAATYTLDLPTALPASQKTLTVDENGACDFYALPVTPTADVVVESAAIQFTETGLLACAIAHGLAYTPVATQIVLTVYQTAGGTVPALRQVLITSIDATNINVYLFCPTFSTNFTVKVVARIHPA